MNVVAGRYRSSNDPIKALLVHLTVKSSHGDPGCSFKFLQPEVSCVLPELKFLLVRRAPFFPVVQCRLSSSRDIQKKDTKVLFPALFNIADEGRIIESSG